MEHDLENNRPERAGGAANLRIKWKPNFFPSERRIVLTRIRWENGPVGVPNGGSSNKLSVSLCFVPQDLWIGAFWKRESDASCILWICLLPCLPIRIHLVRSWGGVFP